MATQADLLKEVRDDVKMLREEVQQLKTDIAIYKAYGRAMNWISFTALPAIGAGLAYFGIKVGFTPLN
jgi:hypothetical protein